MLLATPELVIPAASFKKLMSITDLCEGEVTGFFDVEYQTDFVDSQGGEPRKAFVVGEVYLVKQEAGAADVEMDEDGILDAMEELIAAGKMQMPRGWWHSHVNMQAFFSGTDDNTINNVFLNDTYTVSLVVNKRRDAKASLVLFEDLPYGLGTSPIRIDGLKITVDGSVLEIPEELRKEVEEKVRPHAPSTTNYYNYQENKYAGREGKKNKTCSLPKNKGKALEKIQKLGLRRSWDTDLGDVVFVDVKSGVIWIDTEDQIGWEAYESIMPENTHDFLDPDFLEKPPLTFGKKTNPFEKPRVCRKCRFIELHHRDAFCTEPEFEEMDIEDSSDYFSRQYDEEMGD